MTEEQLKEIRGQELFEFLSGNLEINLQKEYGMDIEYLVAKISLFDEVICSDRIGCFGLSD